MSCVCFFCENNRFHLNRELSLPAEDSIIYEDEDVYITPDLFPLCIGHFLIITKEHSASVGGVSDDIYMSIQNAKEYLLSRVFKTKKVTFFEHGAVFSHTGGSCIDHTHIHTIPQLFDLKPKIEDSEFITSKSVVGEYDNLRSMAKSGIPYVYIKEADGDAFAYEVNGLPSQFMRQVIARKLKIDYNWKNAYRNRTAMQLFLDTLAMGKN